ncbi:MAG: AIR synthase family protein [Nitrososphaerales archaeon]|nr:AIR synthase family protein [Nitrososphaerales archaeon]
MSMNEYGKPGPDFMKRVVFNSLGASDRRTIKGPGRGLDNAVVAVGRTGVMLITTDPMSVIPAVGMERSAWLSVHLVASDYTTSGLRPEFAAFNFNFPDEMRTSDRAWYLRCVGTECQKLGVSIVAGHTGSYPGAGYTVIGGGAMFGFGSRGEYLDPTMARVGDTILMTKGAAIEATATLAFSFPRYVEREAGGVVLRGAKRFIGLCSTVRDAALASSFGKGPSGVTSMHDATEGGVLGALEEVASASGKAFVVDRETVHVPPESEAVCGAFKIDPLTSLSEGTLLLTCNESRAEGLAKRLRRDGVPAFVIGRVRQGRGLWMSEGGRTPRRLRPKPDQYWKAYMLATESGLS